MVDEGIQTESVRAWFTRHLRTALTSLYDPSVLRDSPLAELFGLEQRGNMVSALRRTLIDAIELLRPNASTPSGTRTWRVYQVLRRRYTEQLPQNKVASDLALSIRQLQREEKLAREVLADHLWIVYDLEATKLDITPPSPPPGDRGISPVVHMPTRAQELEWLRNSIPAQMTDVGKMIQEVLETIAPLSASSQVSVEYAAQKSPLRLSLQAPLLRQALLNVVSTAIHCVPRGQVRIQTQSFPQRACIYVRATAHPGALSQRQEYTESFRMAEQLVQLCQGSLAITSSKDEEPASGLDEGEAFAAKFTLAVTEQATVLVIDDNADALQLFRRYLFGTRYRFVGARDAQRGLALAEALAPRIIVLDVMMPEKDGWTLLGQLREHPKTGNISVVVCTILPHEELALALGAAGFIRKPVNRAGLLSALDRQLDLLARRSC